MTLHLAATQKAGGLFNIGSGEARTWLDLARAVFAALKRKPKIEFIEMPEAIRDKYQYFTQANLSRLRAAGYTAPVTPLEDAVSDYVRNYLVPDKPARSRCGLKLFAAGQFQPVKNTNFSCNFGRVLPKYWIRDRINIRSPG